MARVCLCSAMRRAISPTTVLPLPVGAQTMALWPWRMEEAADNCHVSRGKEKWGWICWRVAESESSLSSRGRIGACEKQAELMAALL